MQEQRQLVQIHPAQLLTWALGAPLGIWAAQGVRPVATLKDALWSRIFTAIYSFQFLNDNNHNTVISLLHFRYFTENHPLYWNLIFRLINPLKYRFMHLSIHWENNHFKSDASLYASDVWGVVSIVSGMTPVNPLCKNHFQMSHCVPLSPLSLSLFLHLQ
jgi:hypothetical protein